MVGRCRQRIRRGGYTSRRAATEALSRLRTPDSAEAAGRVLTLSGWLDYWLATRTSQRASTLRAYRSHVRVYLTPYLGRIPLAELTVGQVQAMFTALSRDLGCGDGPSTAASLARIRATLRTALNAALRHGLIAVNPACRVELPPAHRPKAVVDGEPDRRMAPHRRTARCPQRGRGWAGGVFTWLGWCPAPDG